MSNPNIRFSDLTEVWTAAAYEAAAGRTLTDKPAMGQRFVDSLTGKEFLFVENVDTVARAAGDVVAQSLANGVWYEVDEAVTATLEYMAGVCMGAIPASGGRGWIQVYGYHSAIRVEGTSAVAIGESLKMVNAQDYVVKDTAVGTVASYPDKYIVALAAQAVADVVAIAGFIRCR